MLLEKKKEKNGGNFVFTSGKQPKGLSIAPKTLANFLERIAQLYEQGADGKRIGQYALFKFLSPKLRHQPNLFALGNKLGW